MFPGKNRMMFLIDLFSLIFAYLLTKEFLSLTKLLSFEDQIEIMDGQLPGQEFFDNSKIRK